MRGTGLSLSELEADVRTLSEPEREQKLEAVRAYRTQFPALEAQWRVSRPEVLRHEVVWRL
jgi:LmbE family N-acetylglucosaminyl deacetylase